MSKLSGQTAYMWKWINRVMSQVVGAVLSAYATLVLISTVFGVLNIHEDFKVVAKTVNWLAGTPWWVAVALLATWMVFLAVKLWDTELTEAQIEELILKPHKKMLQGIQIRDARRINAVLASFELREVERMERELNLDQISPVSDPRYDAVRKQIKQIMEYEIKRVPVPSGENEFKHFDREEDNSVKSAVLSGDEGSDERKWSSLKEELHLKKHLLKLIIRDADDSPI